MISTTLNTIAEAHRWLVGNIIWCHQSVLTEDNEQTWEGDTMAVTIKTPLTDMIHPLSSFQDQRCRKYAGQLLFGTPSDFDYTYHGRLFNYPDDDEPMITIDQISCLIERLKKCPNTRRAFAITWNPFEDTLNGAVPCLQTIQFLFRNDKLNLISTWRSEDCLSAFGPNAYGVVTLLEHVAAALCVPVGTYTHIITVPHLCPVRDAADLQRWM